MKNKTIKEVVASCVIAEEDWKVTDFGDNKNSPVCCYLEGHGTRIRIFMFIQYYGLALSGHFVSPKSKETLGILRRVREIVEGSHTKSNKLSIASKMLVKSDQKLLSFLDHLFEYLAEDAYNNYYEGRNDEEELTDMVNHILNCTYYIVSRLSLDQISKTLVANGFDHTQIKPRAERVAGAHELSNKLVHIITETDKAVEALEKERFKAEEQAKLKSSQRKGDRIASIIYARIEASQARLHLEKQRIKREAIKAENEAQAFSDSIENNVRADSSWWEERARPNGDLKKSAKIFLRGDEDAEQIKARSKKLHKID